MTETVDCLVVGGGVIGLAVARALATEGREVLVLEAEDRIGAHTSSRNSEVIHAGIYYARGSLKAALCLAGRNALYEYCQKKHLPHARVGKLIVANGVEEVRTLRGILRKGRSNGVTDLEWLEADLVQALEPQVRADAAIYSPSTGIVDSHALMLALQADLEAAGGIVLLNHRVVQAQRHDDFFVLDCLADSRFTVRCRSLINAAGLWASSLAQQLLGLDPKCVPDTCFAKGHYFDYGVSPFRHLIYPVPIIGGLGIHATNDLSGRVRFGPDAEWVDAIDYTFDESRFAVFAAAIGRYFLGFDPDRLSPGYTGIRPKLYRPGEASADFLIAGPNAHGVQNLVNLLGIESPGLTSCLAIGEYVRRLLHECNRFTALR